ncbi:MAG: ABC transporter permease [Anaerolineae bacterium]|nr:ABC transporter permease [Anaerolineae bacterium]
MSSSLRNFLITRVLLTIPMVFILATLVFFVMRVLPGDPINSTLGPRVSEEQREVFRQQLGLDQPILVQYFDFLWRMVSLDFGDSMIGGNRPVRDELSEVFPATLELSVPAMAFTALFGVLSGAYAAQHRKKWNDYALRLFSITIYSIPIFWLGLVFIIVFSTALGLTPVAGRIDAQIGLTLERQTNLLVVDSIVTGNWPALWSALHHLILPSVTLGLALCGVFIRLTRVNMIETLQEDYITAGRARGLRERTLVYRHAMRNTFIPILTLIGLQFAILLAGAVLTETTFSWPGMGRYLVDRIELRDYAAVQAVIAVFAMLVAAITLVMDVLYAFVDPRIRY